MHSNSNARTQPLWVIIFMLGACFLYWLALYLYVPTLPLVVESKTGDLAMVGTVLAMYGLWQCLIRIPVGVWVDAIGSAKATIVGGFLVAGAGAVVMGLGNTGGALLLGRALTGLAAGTWVPLMASFSHLFAPSRAILASSLLTFAGSAGRLLATASTGFLNRMGGYGLAFFLAGVAAVVAAVIVGITRLDRRAPQRPEPAEIMRLISNRKVLLPSILSTIGQFGSWAVTFGFLPILVHELHGDDIIKSLVMSMNLGALTVGNLLNTALVRRVPVRMVLYGSFGLFCAGILVAAAAAHFQMLFICSAMMGIATGVSYPTLMGMSIQHVSVHRRTTAMGIHQSVYAIGMFTGPWIGGLLAELSSVRLMFISVATVCLIASFAVIAVMRPSTPMGQGSDSKL